jgi:hypothetical protein
MLTDELALLLSKAAGSAGLPTPVTVEASIHTAFRSCIDTLSAFTVYRVAAEAEGLPDLVAELEARHAFLREAIAEFSLWQRELRGVPGPAKSILELSDD